MIRELRLSSTRWLVRLALSSVGWSSFAPLFSHAQTNQPPPTIPTQQSEAELPEVEEWKNTISGSGDFMTGLGELALPFRFGLAKDPSVGGLTPENAFGERDSTYTGATVSYWTSENWFFDLSVSQGDSTATIRQLFIDPNSPAITEIKDFKFSNDDNWYQIYARHPVKWLADKKLFDKLPMGAYVRFGLTVVDTTLSSHPQEFGSLGSGTTYQIESETLDLYGNLGLGLSVSPYTSKFSRFRVSLVLEGEGFGGVRKQEISERIDIPGGFAAGTAKVDSPIWGGLGRSTVRLEYFPKGPGGSRCSFFADGGMQVRYNWMLFPEVSGPAGKGKEQVVGELLWGPYMRAGMSVSF